MEIKKLKVKENDGFVALSKSTGIPENHLSERIVERLKQNDYITNSTPEISIQQIADELNTPVRCIVPQIFFIDEWNDEVVELMDSIFISPVVSLSQLDVESIIHKMGAIKTALNWTDEYVGDIEKTDVDLVVGEFHLVFDLSVDWWTVKRRDQPDEHKKEVEISNLMIYFDGTECSLEEVQYIQIVESMKQSVWAY